MLAHRLLLHAPRVECSQRPHDVRHARMATSTRGGNGSMIEDGMNVDQVKVFHVLRQPRRERTRILAGRPELHGEKSCRHTIAIDAEICVNAWLSLVSRHD